MNKRAFIFTLMDNTEFSVNLTCLERGRTSEYLEKIKVLRIGDMPSQRTICVLFVCAPFVTNQTGIGSSLSSLASWGISQYLGPNYPLNLPLSKWDYCYTQKLKLPLGSINFDYSSLFTYSSATVIAFTYADAQTGTTRARRRYKRRELYFRNA